MATRRSDVSQPVAPADQSVRGRPEVILEFVFDGGFFHISVRNIGDGPAIGISIKFNKKITGLGGRREISALALFNNIEFLGPGREIVTLLDSSHSYFSRKQPTKITARIAYRDSAKAKYEATIDHDLEIYRELAYLLPTDHDLDCGRK